MPDLEAKVVKTTVTKAKDKEDVQTVRVEVTGLGDEIKAYLVVKCPPDKSDEVLGHEPRIGDILYLEISNKNRQGTLEETLDEAGKAAKRSKELAIAVDKKLREEFKK